MFEIITYFCCIRRRRTITVYKMVFNEEPNALIWEENVVSQPSSHVILRPKLKPIGKGLQSIRIEYSSGKSFNLAFKATDTMEDLKRKIQSQEGIPVDEQAFYFHGQSCQKVKKEFLSWKCHQCKAVDNRSLNEFEEFRTVFRPEKLIMPSEDQKMVEFHVETIPRGNSVKPESSELSHVTIKTLTGKSIDISAKAHYTSEDLKEQIRQKEGIPKDQQIIIWSGRILGGTSTYDDLNCDCANKDLPNTLGYWNMKNGTVLHLQLRLGGC